MTDPNKMYSLDYQRQILKLLCINLKFFNIYGSLIRPEYFETLPSQMVYSIIHNHILRYQNEIQEHDLLVKIEEYGYQKGLAGQKIQDLMTETKEVFRIPITSEEWVIDSLTRFCRRQELMNAISNSITLLQQDPEGAYEKVLKEIDKAVSVGAGAISEGLQFSDLYTLQEKMKEKYEPSKLFRTGFPKFDEAFGGGFAPGELHIIQGSPKTGKTTFACNIGANALSMGKTVFHVSLEISDLDVGNKYAMRITGLDYKEINNIHSDVYQEKIKDFEKYKPNLFINFWPERSANALNIRSWISKIRSKYGKSPDVIILDYDDCLLPIRGLKDDLYNDSGEVYKDLISLANHFNVPVISFAQPVRDAWELPNDGELIKAGCISHSARKIHSLFSISSLNFADGAKQGILYLDLNRRGDSNVKIKIKRELNRGLFVQDEKP